jgi:hypothetical protein
LKMGGRVWGMQRRTFTISTGKGGKIRVYFQRMVRKQNHVPAALNPLKKSSFVREVLTFALPVKSY